MLRRRCVSRLRRHAGHEAAALLDLSPFDKLVEAQALDLLHPAARRLGGACCCDDSVRAPSQLLAAAQSLLLLDHCCFLIFRRYPCKNLVLHHTAHGPPLQGIADTRTTQQPSGSSARPSLAESYQQYGSLDWPLAKLGASARVRPPQFIVHR